MLKRILLTVGLLAFLPSVVCMAQAPQSMPLAGSWRFEIDRDDAGIGGRWFTRDLEKQLTLPGTMQSQGFGELPSGDTKWTAGIGAQLLGEGKYAPYRNAQGFKTPFWLTPPRYYVGAAWYQRDVEIPAAWQNQRITLRLERPHWETMVWVDNVPMGTRDGLGVEHEYDLTAAMTPGKHRLSIRVDNRVKVPVGNDAHSVSDQTQGNWNGIVGDLKLIAGEKTWLDDVQVYPNLAGKKVRVVVAIGSIAADGGTGTLNVSAASFNSTTKHQAAAKQIAAKWEKEGGKVEFEYELGAGAQLWDEFSPALYLLNLELRPAGAGQKPTSRTVTFGMRELGVSGTQFTINGRKIFLRGTLECCIFPLTGYPPTDVDSWKRILGIARAHGLNHLRFHSWCPPEAAFVAADEIGFYYQVECSCWATFGDGSSLDKWIYEEADRMIRAYGNHPSFVLLAPTNEPGGKNRDRFLGDLMKHWAGKDSRRMYTAGSGWPMIPENQFHVTPAPRIQATRSLNRPPRSDVDYRDFVSKQKVPVVSHEIGQWCVYPNFDEIAKYTGIMKATSLEIFRDFIDKSGMGKQARDFFMASGKFQALLYKEEIEAALRTPGMAGLQLLDLHDFPGQGTAPVGVLDAFWGEKGYIKPEEYRRFCGQVVPLARLTKRVYENNETFETQVDITNFSAADLAAAAPAWKLRDTAGTVLAEGSLPAKTIPTGGLTQLGAISVPLGKVQKATRLTLEVSLPGTPYANDWHFWVYPAKGDDAAAPAGVSIVKTLDEALPKLSAGGKVLLLAGPDRIAGDTYGVFRPVFWNRVTFPSQREHTLGILCDPKHAALATFPTDIHSDWQWWDIQQNGKPMVLDGLPKELTPLIQMIDDWNVCRKLGLVFEGTVGQGTLIVCSIDLESKLETRPVARQLLRSLVEYMGSERFQPAVRLETEQIKSLLRDPLLMKKLGAKVINADGADPNYPAENIVDGDPQTIWHTPWQDGTPPHPHEVTIELARSVKLAGITVLPRQDIHNGQIKGYIIRVSDDGTTWSDAARGSFDESPAEKTVHFAKPQNARFFKLVALSGFRTDRFTAVAEVGVILAKE